MVVEESTDIVTIINADGSVRYSNPATTRLLGYRDTLPAPGAPGWAERFIHRDDRDRVLSFVATVLRLPGAVETVRYRFKHADGSWRQLETVANNLLGDDRLRGVLMVSRDITAREQMTETSSVNALLAELLVAGSTVDQQAVSEAGLDRSVLYEVLVIRLQGSGFVVTETVLAEAARQAGVMSGGLCGAFSAFGVVIIPALRPVEATHPVAERLLKELRARLRVRELRIAVGGARPTARGIQTSFDDAVRLLSLGERLGLDGVITPRRAVLPSMLDAAPRASSSLVKILEPLIEADRRSRAELLETLHCYLASDGSVHKTAEVMHLHRNTIRARLRTIESALGGPVASDKVVLELALLAHELATNAG